jgi:histidine triad (HIT) family protein
MEADATGGQTLASKSAGCNTLVSMARRALMNGATSCVFCNIASGQIPSLKVFEDETTFAFLDINPLAEGHLLVIPKKHYASLPDMPADQIEALTRHFPRLMRAVMDAVGADGCNILQNNGRSAGQEVNHVHWHVIPRKADDGLGYRWNATSYPEGRDEKVRQDVQAALSVPAH